MGLVLPFSRSCGLSLDQCWLGKYLCSPAGSIQRESPVPAPPHPPIVLLRCAWEAVLHPCLGSLMSKGWSGRHGGDCKTVLEGPGPQFQPSASVDGTGGMPWQKLLTSCFEHYLFIATASFNMLGGKGFSLI